MLLLSAVKKVIVKVIKLCSKTQVGHKFPSMHLLWHLFYHGNQEIARVNVEKHRKNPVKDREEKEDNFQEA